MKKRKIQHYFFRLDRICAFPHQSATGCIIKKVIGDVRLSKRQIQYWHLPCFGRYDRNRIGERPANAPAASAKGKVGLSSGGLTGFPNRLSCAAMAKRRNKITCGDILGFKGSASVSDARQRLAERDERARADTRTEIQRWLNDPPPGRSALQKSNAQKGRLSEIKSAAGTVQKGALR